MSPCAKGRRRYALVIGGLSSLLVVGCMTGAGRAANLFEVVWQWRMLLPPRFDHAQPEFARIGDQRHVLLFSKTNGYRNHTAIAAGQALLEQIAADRYWFVYSTDNAAAFMAPTLWQFDSVVFNNVSGPLFTAEQQATLSRFQEDGGGVHRLINQPASPAFAKQFADCIHNGSIVDRTLSSH